MKINKFIAIATLSVLTISCNQTTEKTSSEEAKQTKETSAAAGNIKFKDAKTSEAFMHYHELRDALSKDNMTNAKEHADALGKELATLNGCEPTAITAKTIGNAKSIKEQRDAFVTLNKDLVPFFKAAPVESGKAFVAFCPMANDNKGAYWLSTAKEIKNPYYGEEMISCGEVKETIN